MLSIETKPGWLCDSPSRRELLSVGSLSLFGLGLADLLRLQSRAKASEAAPGSIRMRKASAESVILLYLQGAPSHIDLWDPKPEAPDYIRGEFKPIATAAPGVHVSEMLPLLAQQADKFALIRSLAVPLKGFANHGSAIYILMTGHDASNFSPTGLAVPPSREDLPSMGSIVARYRAAEAGALSYVTVCGPVKESAVTGVGQMAGLMGGACDPFQMYEDPTKPFKIEGFAVPQDVTLGRLRARLDLRALAAGRQSFGTDFDKHYEKAFSLVESSKALNAFHLESEPPTVRERYGMTKFGQSCLLARRLIEAGTRFVTVTWPAGSDTEPEAGPDGSWDTHRNNFPMLKNWRCPVFDRSASALLADLANRGLLERTLVVAIGEFGRSPKIGAGTTGNVGPGGRDHWPGCYTCLVAGGGVRGGQIYGESDRNAASPKTNPVHPYDVISTIYYALGVDLNTEYLDALHRPRRLVDHGRPVVELF